MSLDVSLTLPGVSVSIEPRIFIREDGQNKEISRAEWDARYPGREPFTVAEEVYSANITHNLNKMADAAMLYTCLWRPDEHGITHAEQLIPLLTTGLALLQSAPARFRAFNPERRVGNIHRRKYPFHGRRGFYYRPHGGQRTQRRGHGDWRSDTNCHPQRGGRRIPGATKR